jgi:hypothetical protein
MRIAYYVAVLICTLLQLTACENKSEKTENTLFNPVSTKLATLPTGYEAGDIVFSTDGHHVAVALKKDGKVFMGIDSTIGPPYDEVRDPVFRPGTSRIAYIASIGGKACIVVDGKAGVFYDAVTKPQFLPDGRAVYAAKRIDKWHIVVGGTESGPFTASFDPVPFISPDGKRLAHIEQDVATNKMWMTVSDIDLKGAMKGREYDTVTLVRANTTSGQLLYVVGAGAKKTVVVLDIKAAGCSEKEGVWYDDIKNYAISADGKHLALLALRRGRIVQVTDGKEYPSPTVDMTLNISTAISGTTLYSAVQKDKVATFINGIDTGKYVDTVEYSIFSADGAHFALVAGASSKSYLVIDNYEGPKYDKIVSPRFSPDNNFILYRARNIGQRFVVISDLLGKTIREHPHYEAVWDSVFSPDGKSVGYGVRVGQELWWKVEKL